MKRMVYHGFAAAIFGIAVLALPLHSAEAGSKKGCCKSKSAAFSTYEKKSGECASKAAKAECAGALRKRAKAIGQLSDDLPYHETKRLVLTGEYVCGKCNLSKLDFCQGFFKTSGGKLYPLLTDIRSIEMRKAVHGNDKVRFRVVTRVRLIGGVKYLEVKKFEKI